MPALHQQPCALPSQVFNVDDLKEVVAGNKEARQQVGARASGCSSGCCSCQGRRRGQSGRSTELPPDCLHPLITHLLPPPTPPPSPHSPLQAAAEAEVLIQQEQRSFEGWRDSLETVPTIKALRSKVGGRAPLPSRMLGRAAPQYPVLQATAQPHQRRQDYPSTTLSWLPLLHRSLQPETHAHTHSQVEGIRASEFEKAVNKLGDSVNKKQLRAVEDLSKVGSLGWGGRPLT